jgi:hypothetical protein
MAIYLQKFHSSNHSILYQYHQHHPTPLLEIPSFVRVTSTYHSNHDPYLSIAIA